METHDSTEQPSITISLKKFLELVLREDDNVKIDDPLYIEFLSKHKNESLFHLITGVETTVWNPRDWATAFQRYETQKLASESRVATWNLRQEIKEELKELICAKMGRLGVEDSFAETILATKNVGLASAMGGSEDLCQKIQTLK